MDKSGKTEEFFWDGLALIKRGGTSYVNEPAVTGGNPILATNDKSEKVLFNDMLGSTMGSVSSDKYKAVDMTLFGESKTEDEDAFFTGKPEVDGLGYAFLFRNYRSSLGKWQTPDPLGHPDGWNNKAYVDNRVINCIDWQGGEIFKISEAFDPQTFYVQYLGQNYFALGTPSNMINCTAQFAATVDSATFIGWKTGSFTTSSFQVQYRNGKDDPKNYNASASSSAIIAANSSIYTITENGITYRARDYVMTITTAIQPSPLGTCYKTTAPQYITVKEEISE